MPCPISLLKERDSEIRCHVYSRALNSIIQARMWLSETISVLWCHEQRSCVALHLCMYISSCWTNTHWMKYVLRNLCRLFGRGDVLLFWDYLSCLYWICDLLRVVSNGGTIVINGLVSELAKRISTG